MLPIWTPKDCLFCKTNQNDLLYSLAFNFFALLCSVATFAQLVPSPAHEYKSIRSSQSQSLQIIGFNCSTVKKALQGIRVMNLALKEFYWTPSHLACDDVLNKNTQDAIFCLEGSGKDISLAEFKSYCKRNFHAIRYVAVPKHKKEHVEIYVALNKPSERLPVRIGRTPYGNTIAASVQIISREDSRQALVGKAYRKLFNMHNGWGSYLKPLVSASVIRIKKLQFIVIFKFKNRYLDELQGQ